MREEAVNMENAAHIFYIHAAARISDAKTRKLLGDLALAEAGHVQAPNRLDEAHVPDDVREEEER